MPSCRTASSVSPDGSWRMQNILSVRAYRHWTLWDAVLQDHLARVAYQRRALRIHTMESGISCKPHCDAAPDTSMERSLAAYCRAW
jgi:hypothetical protein